MTDTTVVTAGRALLRFSGTVDALSHAERAWLLCRTVVPQAAIKASAVRSVAAVRARGDAALYEMAQEFDGLVLGALDVPRDEWERAHERLDPVLRRAMERAARNIETVHRAFALVAQEVSPEAGIVVGRRPDPLGRVGVYAPGGRATYPSSVLMAAIPARVAGVREIILASPPDRTGMPSTVVLAAAALSGVTRVFAIGGAGAVAAMAYGTETVPRVDRIVGPGNAYVAAAKVLVADQVSIDAPAGPSELLVIADDSSDPATVAIEMIAQAEHDPLACVVAVVAGDDVADRIEDELRVRARAARRSAIVCEALSGQGAVIRVESVAAAVALANAYAPEHLLLAIASAEAVLPDIRNAGSVFVGASSSVAFGDYMTGANHVLPTGGSARCYSGLSPLDFVRWTTYQRVSALAAQGLASDTGAFADAEGLFAHASAARRWSDPS